MDTVQTSFNDREGKSAAFRVEIHARLSANTRRHSMFSVFLYTPHGTGIVFEVIVALT